MKELEEAGSVFYYSTKTGEQDVTLHHGIRIDGALDEAAMLAFCRENDIRLLIDAAHPFATALHQTVANVATRLVLPAIRFERIFPPRDEDITWCDNYQDIPHDMNILLATTGVQTISKLKPLEQQGIKIFYRILPRESSIALAHKQGATDDQLCFFQEGEDETIIFQQLHPDAVLLKESGLTGGYVDKVHAARALGIRIIALKRPPTPTIFHCVNGEHGLRRMVEKLLPTFYPLHSGLTTGTCATAAAVAAAKWLFEHEKPESVPVRLPNGETIQVGGIEYLSDSDQSNIPGILAGDSTFVSLKRAATFQRREASQQVTCSIRKDSGDDPDVTRGIEIRATISPSDHFEVRGGQGIGTITQSGFDFPPGSPAINKAPREMLWDNLRRPVIVTISVPEGEAIARRTFNPRLGIVGGISIIGVSGIIKPFSETGFLGSIRKCMEVAKAVGADRVVINSGAKSEQFVKTQYPDLPAACFVEYGNFIGETIKIAAELGISQVTLGIMLGKAVKLAEGNLDTHSHKVVMNKAFICSMLQEAGCEQHVLDKVESLTLARELWTLIPPSLLPAFCRVVISHCYRHCASLLPNSQLTILLIDEKGTIYNYEL